MNENTLPKKIRLGRNDPCPCGSGKKYKKCHKDFQSILDRLDRAIRIGNTNENEEDIQKQIKSQSQQAGS